LGLPVAAIEAPKPRGMSATGANRRLQFERLINVLHEKAPQAKLAFNSQPADSDKAALRWLPTSPSSLRLKSQTRVQTTFTNSGKPPIAEIQMWDTTAN
jgi:hypothetical protein